MPHVDTSSGPTHYTDSGGAGPVLAFGHGLFMNQTQWRKVIPLLTEYRCIAPVLPMGAHTTPMKPDADLSQLGGQFMVSDDREDRIGRLVLASCEAFDNFPPTPASTPHGIPLVHDRVDQRHP